MGTLVVRPILAEERQRFDETLEAEHWLGARLVGEVLRYVATEDGAWCALLGFGASALCVRSREALLGWSDEQRHRRLRYITNNQRFCVLAARRRPNLASAVLGRALRRLSADFEARWGHAVVAVETFTDPALHVGTCYQASNFTALGTTAGYGRRSGRFVYHGAKKVYWFRPLRRDATALLAAAFDHPALARRSAMTAPDLNRLDFPSLLAALNTLEDPRRPRGIRHRLPQILAVAVIAALRGATSLVAMGEIASELGAEALARLGARVSPSTGRRQAPEESTIRRTLRAIDPDALDKIVTAWLAAQIGAGNVAADQVPDVDFAVAAAEDEPAQQAEDAADDDDGTPSAPPATPAPRPAVALDGKTLRGARLADGRRVHLVSVLAHDEAVTIAQCNVDTKTNEITVFRPLLEPLDLAGQVVTADALHTQRAHAHFLVEHKQADYLFGLKKNQPKLLATAKRLLADRPIAYETHERGHGRIDDRYFWVAPLAAAPQPKPLARRRGCARWVAQVAPTLQPKPRFPYAAQVIAVRRERADLSNHNKSVQTSYYVTSLEEQEAGPKQLAGYIRGQWGIENRNHYVRDRTFGEDLCQVRKGGTPQVLGTLRNLAISTLRLAGFQNIAAGLRWMTWDHRRTLQFLGL